MDVHQQVDRSSFGYAQEVQIQVYNPLTGKHDIKFTAHKSFYRTPTLVSIWATAPYLNNNSVGIYTGDPSIAGRMAAYEDGMTKLLWPETRLGRSANSGSSFFSMGNRSGSVLSSVVTKIDLVEYEPGFHRGSRAHLWDTTSVIKISRR
jgi:hypothetical protein